MYVDVHLRVIITRGRKKKPIQHPHLSILGSTIVIIAEHSKPDARIVDRGIRLHTMLDPVGFVDTTNACNFFIVRKGTVWTSTGDYFMNGVTCQKVIDLCRDNDIPVLARNFSLADTYGVDDVFPTGTFGAQSLVFGNYGRVIGAGKSGPISHRIRSLNKTLIARSGNEQKWVRDQGSGAKTTAR